MEVETHCQEVAVLVVYVEPKAALVLLQKQHLLNTETPAKEYSLLGRVNSWGTLPN
jgi:hypothetical protein